MIVLITLAHYLLMCRIWPAFEHGSNTLKNEQMVENQTDGVRNGLKLPPVHLSSRVGGGAIPEIIDKKWLCCRFGIDIRSGRRSKRLRKLVFTDELLALLNLTEEAWKQCRQFSRPQTIIILDYLQIHD